MEIGKIYKQVSVDEYHVTRQGEGFDVKFTFVSAGITDCVALCGVQDAHSLSELLSAKRLWVKPAENGDGAYVLGISNEFYTEILFERLGR